MKNYELLAIFKPSLDSEELDKAIEKITEEIKSYSGSVSSVDKIGRKKLAYDVQGYRDGFFANLILSVPAESIVEFKRNLKLNDNVLRFMFMEESKKAQTV
jgi:small subunit ribosomal protein S6